MYIYWNGQWYFCENANQNSIVKCGSAFVHVYSTSGKHAIGVEEAEDNGNALTARKATAQEALENR